MNSFFKAIKDLTVGELIELESFLGLNERQVRLIHEKIVELMEEEQTQRSRYHVGSFTEYTVDSFTEEGVQYTVKRWTKPERKWECDCPHFKFRKGFCKHIHYVQDTALI